MSVRESQDMAAAAPTNVPLKRIRGLLDLTRSPNEHEAARAREQLDEYLRRYNLTEADLIEKVREVAQPQTLALDGNQRQELARIIASSRSVKSMVGRGIAFEGISEAARDARELFVALTDIVEKNCELAPGNPESDQFLWRTCFWLGYIEAIQHQLEPEHRLPPEALDKLVAAAKAPPVIERAADAFEDYRARHNHMGAAQAHMLAESFKARAHDAGYNLGMQIPVPIYRGKR